MAVRRVVLILEDEARIGMDMAMSMEEAGFTVIGPFRSSEKALESLRNETPDIGLLDLNLGDGKTSETVAERLVELGRPFVFLTGYSASSHPVVKRFDGVRCLSKPVDMKAVTGIVAAEAGQQANPHSRPKQLTATARHSGFTDARFCRCRNRCCRTTGPRYPRGPGLGPQCNDRSAIGALGL